MRDRQTSMWFTFVGAIWVGGWGWLMFRYPERIASLNRRFGGGSFFSGPRYTLFLKRLGAVEMALAGLSLLGESLALCFGWYR